MYICLYLRNQHTYNKGDKDMLDAKVSQLLNQQVNKEFYSAYLYLDISNYYEKNPPRRIRKLVQDSGAGRTRPCNADVPVSAQQ